MRLLKDSISIIIILLVFLCGCQVDNNEYDEKYLIEVENIYNQIDDEYYVYFYKDNCPYCDDVFEIINKYLGTKEEGYTKLYVCDLSDKYQISYNIYYEDNVTTIKLLNNEILEFDSSILQLSKKGTEYICEFTNGKKDSFVIEDDILKTKNNYISKIEKVDEEIISSIIKRVYNGDGGQGSKGTYFVDGVSKYEDLYISGVPSLIKINNDKISTFIVSGRKDIKEYFENILNNK